jgi:hypothetical protein
MQIYEGVNHFAADNNLKGKINDINDKKGENDESSD